jgi:hypothetical protein
MDQVFVLALSRIRARVGDYILAEAIEPEAFGEALFGEAQARKREWQRAAAG